MYTLMVRRSDQMQRTLAKHKTRLLMMGCTEISKTWPACGWIQRLFETVLKNIEEKCLTQPMLCQSSTFTDTQTLDQAANRIGEDAHVSNERPQQHNTGQPASGLPVGKDATINLPNASMHSSQLNMSDTFNPEFWNGFLPDFIGQGYFPHSTDFSFQDG